MVTIAGAAYKGVFGLKFKYPYNLFISALSLDSLKR